MNNSEKKDGTEMCSVPINKIRYKSKEKDGYYMWI